MDKLNVGVVIDNILPKKGGGGYSYTSRLINAIDSFSFDENINIVFISSDTRNKDWKFQKQLVCLDDRSINVGSRRFAIFTFLKKLPLPRVFGIRIESKIESIIRKKRKTFLKINDIHILYYIKPGHSFCDFDFIATHWDMAYKNLFEHRSLKVFESGKKRVATYLGRALFIIAESIAGKDELVFYQRINPDRIHVMPMFAGGVVEVEISRKREEEVLEKLGLAGHEFIFYPAQFWAFKNHYNLLIAFKTVLKTFPELKLVFCGSHFNTFDYIVNKVRKFELESSVIFLGFISDEELKVLYLRSAGMVFPSMHGPTNMPILEAMELGCKLACSNMKGHIEQAKNWATFFDPLDSNDMAQAIDIMLNENKKISRNVYTVHYSMECLNNAFRKIRNLRLTYHY